MSGSSLMDALIDPGVQALAGAAQGFAQAALPTRMPIPAGAAIGMGLGGLAQGAGNALSLQRANMQNQLAASALPMELAKNKMLASFWQHPEQIQTMMGGASPATAPPGNPTQPMPAASPVAGGGMAGASNPAIQPIIEAEAQKNGIPLPLATAYLQQESSLGTNPAANGNIGQITFKTASMPGYGMTPISGADLKDPAKNIAFSLQYLRKAGDAAGVTNWNDPSQWGTALKAYNGGGDPNYVQNVARWLPKGTQVGIPEAPVQQPFQVAQAGGGAIPVPGQAQGAAPTQTSEGSISAAEALNRSQQFFTQANQLEQAQNRAKALQSQGFFMAIPPPGDPVAIRAQGQKYLDLALAGPKAAEEARARAPFQTSRVNAGGVLYDANGNVKGFAPLQSHEVITSGPNAGTVGTVLRNPLTNEIIGGQPTEQNLTGAPKGFIPQAIPPQQEGRLKAQGEVEAQDIQHDRKVIEEDLAHVIDIAQPGQQQLLLLRSLAPQADTGALGDFRAAIKNYFNTFVPGGAGQLLGDAAPMQEFNKVALMQAGKQERGDLGARGGFRAIELYRNANPNLEMQPNANLHMANALLLAHQRDVDYTQGVSQHYLTNRAGFLDPQTPKPYVPIAAYDKQFMSTFKPELYYSAIEAANGKGEDVWAQGLTAQQKQIVAGIVKRADPNAVINVGGHMVPIADVTKTIGPEQIMGMGQQ